MKMKKRNNSGTEETMWTSEFRNSTWSYTNTMVSESDENTQKEFSNRIHISNLEDYFIERKNSDKLRAEFEHIGKGPYYPCTVGADKENEKKNRDSTILPYDNNRVLLEKLSNDPHSDYINASYIDGYRFPKKYIVAQGPRPLRMADFWRMVWQQKSCKIAMVTNLVESGEAKCKRYWPKKSGMYGNVKVQLVDQDMLVDYTIRNFIISQNNETRQVKQFQYTTWPEKRIPLYTLPLLTFIGNIRDFNSLDQAPIIVHSSAGAGRAGAYILLDYMLDMMQWEQHVDFMACLHSMRHQRMNMVETPEQYMFIYETLVDALLPYKTSIYSQEFVVRLKELKSIDPSTGLNHLDTEFKRLKRLCPVNKVVDTGQRINQQWNNFSSFGPDVLSKSQCLSSCWVDGYRKRKAFKVTTVPHSKEVITYWKSIFDDNICTIVLLNNLDSIDQHGGFRYWPREKSLVNFGEFSLEYVSKDCQEDVIIRIFKLINNEKLNHKGTNETRLIKHFHVTNWHSTEKVPSSPIVLLCLIDKVEKWLQESAGYPIIVQCLDGIRASGIYCACSFICNKIKLEHEVDVYLAVKTVQQFCPEFIGCLEQYYFCYMYAEFFIEKFRDYANFS